MYNNTGESELTRLQRLRDTYNPKINEIKETIIALKKITSADVRRVVRKVTWSPGTIYEMYRHDYSVLNPSPITKSANLYTSNYYVVNQDYRVYICIDNGSTGINSTGNASKDEPLFTDLEPSKAGESGDGYIWKYLYTISPSDIIKFDSTEYITVPNDWETSTNPQIEAIRDNGNSDVNENQIKKVYIDDAGANYSNILGQEVDILGDGTGGKVIIDVEGGKIVNATVSSGGKGYSYGIVDLGALNLSTTSTPAKLIPIIPPSKGHGYDIYKELGTDKILVYSRFDDSNRDFPVDTKFAQIGILKNPESSTSETLFEDNYFDYIIDDGPHTLESQVLCIQKYLPKVKSGGKIIIEDIQKIEWIKILESCIDKNIAESWRTIDIRESKGRWDDIIFEITKK
jgi:hypothetical protein